MVDAPRRAWLDRSLVSHGRRRMVQQNPCSIALAVHAPKEARNWHAHARAISVVGAFQTHLGHAQLYRAYVAFILVTVPTAEQFHTGRNLLNTCEHFTSCGLYTCSRV